MRVAVLGAAGALGSEVVRLLIARGDEITAFVRRAGSATAAHVAECVGDAREPEAVRAALVGAEAVVDVVGAGTLGRTDLESTVIANVVNAMSAFGSKRLIAMSAGMVVRTNLVLDYLLKPTIFRHILAEHRRVEEVVMRADLDWTIVRPPRLVSRPARGYAAFTGTRYSGSMSIAREDAAQFIADELTRRAFVRQAVFVSAARE
jgi:putative NADH-flavin reductase